MEVVAALSVLGRAAWRLLKLCNECWRDTEKDDVDNDDFLNNSGTDDFEDSELEPVKKKKSVEKRRSNIKTKRTSSSSSDVVTWVYTTIENAVDLIDTAVVGGYDTEDNGLWLIRARFRDQVIPGTLNLSKNKAVVPIMKEGEIVVKNFDNFQVLCIAPELINSISWIKCSNGDVPKNAVEAGRTSQEKLYIGREIQEDEGHPGQGIVLPGMVKPSHGLLYVTYDNKFYFGHKLYEVLCINHESL